MLFTKINFPRNVCWTGEKQYWQVWRNMFAKLRSFFCSKPKKSTSLYSLYQLILPEFSNEHEKGNFYSHAETFLLKSRSFLVQNADKFERNFKFFNEPIFPRSVSWTSNNAFFTTLLQWFHRKTKFYSLEAENDRKIVSFARETIFCEKLLLTRKRQFWRSFRYNFCCIQVFSMKSAKIE